MKKCLLLALTVLGFTSFSYAAPEETSLRCSDRAVGATLLINSQWGTVAFLNDNYDTAQELINEPNGRFGLQCRQAAGRAVECVGNWAFEQAPAKVTFAKDSAGKISATFSRSPYYGGETVTIECVQSTASSK